MDFDEVINKRYSVRGYLDKPVEQEKLDYVLKAATIAPTGVNYQPFKIFVIDTKKYKDDLSKIYPAEWFCQAPYVLCVVSQKDKAWTRKWDNKNISDINQLLERIGGTKFSRGFYDYYWSTTEGNLNMAWFECFYALDGGIYDKNAGYRVRFVRDID